ncbi:MAG TPA: methyl-accepting chemotaxis protein [Acetobacteraceae bacterium]|jgi:methyl-accepting chemotaxis protein
MHTLLRLFAHGSIVAKLAIMAAAGAVFMMLVAVTVLLIARGELAAERVEKAHAVVDGVWSMADSFKHAADSGAMTEQEAKARFFAASGAIWFEDHSNYVFIYDTETGLCVLNSGNPPLLGKDVRGLKDSNGVPFASMMIDIAKRGTEGTVRYAFPKGTNATPMEKIAYVRGFAPWHMMIATVEYMSDIDDTFWLMARTAGAVIAVLLLVSIAIAWAVARSIVKPLSGLGARMATLSAGDLEAPVTGTDRRNELGEMARALSVFKDSMAESARLRAAQDAAKLQAAAAYKATLNRMADKFESEVGALVGMLSSGSAELEATAQSMTGTANQSSQQAAAVAAASEEASAGLQTVASAAEELTASIGEIGRQVAKSSLITGKAVGDAKRTDAIVRALAEGAEKIGAVVGLITNIASQTNLLALNATIEAARAGDAGKGFAVVASEVKSLANQTGKATEEIGAQITQIQAATTEAVEAIRDISATIEEVSAIATTIASAVEEQSAATSEIARNVQQTTEAAREVTAGIGGVSQAARETGAAAGQVLSSASDVSKQVGQLSSAANTFVAGVKAA